MTTPTTHPATFPTQAARLAWFREQLATQAKWAIRAMELVYANQTKAEQTAEQTTEDNGVGFTGLDGKILASFAKQVLRWRDEKEHKYPCPLSPKQMALVYKKMPKYAKQVLGMIDAENIFPVVKATAPAHKEAPAATATA
jgi:hypothetical protein